MVKGDILDSICVAFHCLLKVSRLIVPNLKEQPTVTLDTIEKPFATGYEELDTPCAFIHALQAMAAPVLAKQEWGQCYPPSNFRFSKRVLIVSQGWCCYNWKLQELVDYRLWESPVLYSCNSPWLWHLLNMTVPNWNQIQSQSEEQSRLIHTPSFHTKVKVGVVRGKTKEDRIQGTYM